MDQSDAESDEGNEAYLVCYGENGNMVERIVLNTTRLMALMK